MEYNQTIDDEATPHCLAVVFSNKAYNLIIGESFKKDPLETGGILLGHILDNGVWLVMEVLPPGPKSIFERAYFEYDLAFVNYLAQSTAEQYNLKLELLGLWHRHPGSFDHFSSTDDGTNSTFAKLNAHGAISGLVNIDPNFRFTMYHVDPIDFGYTEVEIAAGDEMIPEDYFELRYYPHAGFNPSKSYNKTFATQLSQQGAQYTQEREEQNQNDGYSSEEHIVIYDDNTTSQVADTSCQWDIDAILENNKIQVGIENILEQVNRFGTSGHYLFELRYDTDWYLEIKQQTDAGEYGIYKAYIKGFANIPQQNSYSSPINFSVALKDNVDIVVSQSIHWLEESFRLLLNTKK